MRSVGRKDRRLELAVDRLMDAAITVRARELAGGKDPRNFRSEAARQLIAAGVDATDGLERRADRLIREEDSRADSSRE